MENLYQKLKGGKKKSLKQESVSHKNFVSEKV